MHDVNFAFNKKYFHILPDNLRFANIMGGQLGITSYCYINRHYLDMAHILVNVMTMAHMTRPQHVQGLRKMALVHL